MRLVHVSPHLPPDQAANALLPAQLGRWMADRGHQVAFVAHGAAQARGPQPSAAGPLADLPIRWIPRRGRALAAERLLKLDAWRLVRRVHAALDDVASDADLLHLHSSGLVIEAAAAWARRRSTPYVLTLYGTEIWHYKRRWPIDPFTRAYTRAAQVTFYSERLLERARHLGLDREGLSVVYPPVAESFKPLGDAARADCRQRLGLHEGSLVLNVKRLHPLAGQRSLVEAFARLHAARGDVQLVICGEGAERDALERQVQSLGLGRHVTFAGLVPNETIAQYMAAADVFVLPSLLEALPTVAVEALASGTPVISTDHPGGLELQGVFGDDVGVVPGGNVELLSRAVAEFLRQPRRTRPSTAERVDRLFRPAAVIRAFEEVYQHTLAQRPR